MMKNSTHWFSRIRALALASALVVALACPQPQPKMEKAGAPDMNPQPTSGQPDRPAASTAQTPAPAMAAESTTATVTDVVRGTNGFGLALLNTLTRGGAAENRFISPASVAIALAMTMNGAGGQTRTAMADTLGLAGLDDAQVNQAHLALRQALTGEKQGVTLSIANSLWARQGTTFEPSFLIVNTTFFDAHVQPLNFASPEAAGTINNWVSKATQEKIPTIVDGPIDPSTVLFLINAVYFKGDWTVPFDPALTADAPFNAPGTDQPAMVPMMKREGHFDLLKNDDFQAVRLPYGADKRLAMILVLPRPGIVPEALARGLTADTIAAWSAGFRSVDGELKIPRFTLRDDLELKAPLSALGMGVAFTGQADFSRMMPPPARLLIDAVRHVTFIDVNEQGTEAAAVTSVIMAMSAMLEKPVVVFDRPFLFMIRDESSGLILFLGVLNDPHAATTG